MKKPKSFVSKAIKSKSEISKADYVTFPKLEPEVKNSLIPARFLPEKAGNLSVEVYARLAQIYGFSEFNYLHAVVEDFGDDDDIVEPVAKADESDGGNTSFVNFGDLLSSEGEKEEVSNNFGDMLNTAGETGTKDSDLSTLDTKDKPVLGEPASTEAKMDDESGSQISNDLFSEVQQEKTNLVPSESMEAKVDGSKLNDLLSSGTTQDSKAKPDFGSLLSTTTEQTDAGEIPKFSDLLSVGAEQGTKIEPSLKGLPTITAHEGTLAEVLAASSGDTPDIFKTPKNPERGPEPGPSQYADLPIFLLPPFSEFRLLHMDPMVISVENFFTDEECDRYIANSLKDPSEPDVPMQIQSQTVGQDAKSRAQRTSTTWFHHFHTVPEILAKASRLLGIDSIDCWEEVQTVR